MIMELVLGVMCLVTALSAFRAALHDRALWPVLHGAVSVVVGWHGLARIVGALDASTWGAVHPITLPTVVVLCALLHLARLNVIVEARR